MNSSYPCPDDGAAPAAHAYPLLIKQLLHAPLATRPEQEIVYGDRVRHDYWTFRHRIGQLASGLSSIGVGAGDVVAVMDWDSHRYLECYHAIPMMGAVLMTANVRLSPDQLLYTLNHSGARVVLVHRDFLPLLAGLRDRLETARHFVLIADGDAGGLPDGFADEYERLVAAGSPDFAFPDFDEQTRATTFYTTGTTGLPKAVAFTHRQLVLHTLAGMAALSSPRERGRVHRDDVYMPITPMFHVHAWGMPYIATALGLKQVYPGRYAPDGLLALIARESVTFSHCVPTLLGMILDSPASAAADLSSWKVIVGGSPLPEGLARAALARGIEVYTGYGMSETCPLMTIAQVDAPLAAGDAPDDDIARRTKAGVPLPLVDLRIVDAQFRDVPHDGRSAGEVVVRMPWATQGYLGDASASAALWAGGYLHTNDIGVIDPDGRLQITDRIKDVIKTGGEWVSSLELEDILSRHPAVRESAVIGVKDARWGERPLALVVLADDHVGRVEPAELQAHVKQVADRGLISRYAVPERLLIVDAIEKTSVGKINKRALRERYQPD
ncbi:MULTISPECIES: fatty acid--CoA ligase [Burkholderia]|uniref:Medium-chain-fatty-acid--CoA ligase n=1 Tax=Burkholderia cepacia GG4 TaxID=1009846 RepID=A0A9W3PCN6_BURCE|nr:MULTISPECIES: fatty acid--CoA ligase [Burkholderia]AFQ51836.1 Medium-chain-fatty-acid--CoA ligase [Burkholderia cepacia GG4]